MFTLLCTKGPLQGEMFFLQGKERFTVGRQEGSEMWLDSPRVSRRHAEFFLQGIHLFLKDLGSQNGTELNGVRLESGDVEVAIELRTGDLIGLGDYVFEVQQEGPAPEDPFAALAVLDEAYKALSVAKSRGEFAAAMAQLALRHLGAERLCLFDFDPREKTLVPLHFANSPAFEPSMMALHHVMNKKETIFTVDAGKDERFKDGQSVMGAGVRSILCAPIKRRKDLGRELVGALYADTLQRESAFDAGKTAVIDAIANLIAIGYQRFESPKTP